MALGDLSGDLHLVTLVALIALAGTYAAVLRNSDSTYCSSLA